MARRLHQGAIMTDLLTVTRHIRIGLVGVMISGVSVLATGVQIECLPTPCAWGAGWALDATANANVTNPAPGEWFIGLTPQYEPLPWWRVRVCDDANDCSDWMNETPLECDPTVSDGGCDSTVYHVERE
jgi:hypothetical protein